MKVSHKIHPGLNPSLDAGLPNPPVFCRATDGPWLPWWPCHCLWPFWMARSSSCPQLCWRSWEDGRVRGGKGMMYRLMMHPCMYVMVTCTCSCEY